MGLFLEIHPDNPQPRLIKQAVDIMRQGGVIAYPTDSSYALGCQIGDKGAVTRLRRIRGIDERHNLTLVCRDLSEISTYAKIENTDYRLLKSLTPGPYTFILRATSEVPRILMHPKRRHIGLRVMDVPIVNALLEELNQPIMSTTLILPGNEFPETDAEEIEEKIGNYLHLVIDGGHCGVEPTTVIDLTGEVPFLKRQGKGTEHGL